MDTANTYFLFPAIAELRQGDLSPQRARQLKEFIAANVGDPEALISLIGDTDTETLKAYTDTPGQPSTEATIDSFIEKFGGGLADTSDLMLPGSEENPPSEIEEKPESEEDMRQKVKELVKNREYQAAIEIMEAFYLNNPKKNIYFADQIRFIRKLMLNDSNKKS